MAKRPGGSKRAAPATDEPRPVGSTPAPPAALHVSTMTWSTTTTLHRVHLDRYAGDQLNPGVEGNARFSPIKNAKGKTIPTLYGGSTFECAAMESVFHDVSFAPGYKNYDKAKLAGQVHSQLKLGTDVVLADLRSKALRKLGIQRKQLIDTEKDQYPATRRWAEAIHAQHPDVQGLCWTSRQDDSAQAVVLFGDRIGKGLLRQVGASRSLLDDGAAYDELLDLAEQIGVNIVPGKM
ncbi:MAG: RES family NAD+ phosphorylase [Phycisphaeraceae bacterium]|nr:RES family NAD+ phosphorylase [Phycisphaeraceae bacterium]